MRPWPLTECPFQRPPIAIEPLPKYQRTDAHLSGPRSKWLRHTTVCQEDGLPGVVGLLASCRPTTVGRRVRSVVVDTLQRVSWRRSATHVAQERLKLRPLSTDCDATSAVSRIGRVLWIVAAATHSAPRLVLRATGIVPCVAVTESCSVSHGTAPAAGTRLTSSQVRALDVSRRSAIADTGIPTLFVSTMLRRAQDGPTPVFRTNGEQRVRRSHARNHTPRLTA
jgi:hypothetical protein